MKVQNYYNVMRRSKELGKILGEGKFSDAKILCDELTKQDFPRNRIECLVNEYYLIWKNRTIDSKAEELKKEFREYFLKSA